eukprot:TRINITY_DN8509_c3_g1_i1.p1 TRINITY_DN8509_c3_g1~~TRINITY_DN8509_c3_g1_i1.p1  ORF type:complete len:377 (+),score=56.01 TRINITY_DN8509_c3_g1_i1:146-1132(+)
MGKLDVRIVGAKNLANTQHIGTSDPYCVVSCEGKKYRTTTINNSLNPSWGEKFTFMVADPASSRLHIEIYNHNMMHDDKMGHYSLGLAGLVRGKVSEGEYILKDCKKGTIIVRMKAEDFGEDPSVAPSAPPAPGAYPPPAGNRQDVPAGYPPQGAPGGYPPAGYPNSAPSGYPPAPGGYPPAQGGYPPAPAQGGYPPAPAQGGYPPAPSGYPPAPGGYPPQGGPAYGGAVPDNRTNISNDDINKKILTNATINTCDIIDCVLNNCRVTKADFKGHNTLVNCTVREIDVYGTVVLQNGGTFEWGEVKPGGSLINEGSTRVKDIDNYHGY